VGIVRGAHLHAEADALVVKLRRVNNCFTYSGNAATRPGLEFAPGGPDVKLLG